MKKYKIAKTLNILLSLSFTIVLMVGAYNAWSLYGRYSLYSFFVSLLIHGGLGLMLYLGIDFLIKKMFKND